MRARAAAITLLSALAAAQAFRTSLSDVGRSGGGDLRARVVAARAYVLHLDPYRPVPGQPLDEKLVDPYQRVLEFSRITNPPTVIAAYGLVAGLPYARQRRLFFALEWAALLASIALLAATLPSRTQRAAFAAVALLFFAGGSLFRLHVERGQVYAFLLLAASLGALAALSGSRDLLAGLAFGALVAGRPNAAIFVLVTGLLGSTRLALWSGLSALALAAPTFQHTGIWQEYAGAMAQTETEVLGFARYTLLPEPPPLYLEGTDFRAMLAPLSADLNVYAALRRVCEAGGWPVGEAARWLARALGVAAAAAFATLAFALRGRLSRRAALALALTTVVALDYLAPVRWGYNDLLFLAPLALLWPEWAAAAHAWPLAISLLALVLGSQPFGLLDAATATAIRSAGVMGALIGWPLLRLARRGGTAGA